MKTLLVGGPSNGTVMHIEGFEGLNSVRVEHDGKQFEYSQKIFQYEIGERKRSHEPYNRAWIIYAHGEQPPAKEIIQMILKADIPPAFG